MVAYNTVKEYFNPTEEDGTVARMEIDELVKSIIWVPPGTDCMSRDVCVRQWYYPSPSRNSGGYITIALIKGKEQDPYSDYAKPFIRLGVTAGVRAYVEGLESTEVNVEIEDYRTSKEAVQRACEMFVNRFQKPASQGNVQVFYDESKFMWCWKRPDSAKFVKDALGFAFHVETCHSVFKISGDGIVPDEYMIFTDADTRAIARGTHAEIMNYNSVYYFKTALIPIYLNSLPFDSIMSYVPQSQASRYEYLVVDGERRYLNMPRAVNALLNYSIHPYNARIDALLPGDKLFLRGKTDLYAKRPSNEVPFLGFELEACSNKSEVGTNKTADVFKEHMPYMVLCKGDGSISPEGFETVSVPATLDFWQESNLSETLDTMRLPPYNMRSFEHSSCGFHVHVSRSALSVLDLQKIERFVHNPDNLAFMTKVAGRGSGMYQNYYPDLFNNRKKWTAKNQDSATTRSERAGRTVFEGIRYFEATTLEGVARNAANTYTNEISDPDDAWQRLMALHAFCNSYTSYTSLDNLLNENYSAIQDRYENVHHYGFGAWYTAASRVNMESSNNRMLHAVCVHTVDDGNLKGEYLNLHKAMFEEVLCPGKPEFSAIVKMFFPEWNLITPVVTVNGAVSETPAVPDWRAGLKKSTAPFKRSLNNTAARMIKGGPVGKGVMQRYDALNTTNANTVEFRMFKGTMNGTTVMRYLEFVDALVRFVACTSATAEGVHYSAFVKWLRSDSFNVARYEHLVSFISENGFLDRKEIRRRVLPQVVSADNIVAGLVAAVACGFADQKEAEPIGTFAFSNREEVEQPSPVTSSPFRATPDDGWLGDPDEIPDEPDYPDEPEEEEAYENPVRFEDLEEGPALPPPPPPAPLRAGSTFTLPNGGLCTCSSCRRTRGEIV